MDYEKQATDVLSKEGSPLPADVIAAMQKFVAKVEAGRARSVETYNEFKHLLEKYR